MPFEIPFRNLAPEFVRAADTGIWLPVGNQVNRNFDDLNNQVSKVTDQLAVAISDLAVVVADLADTQAELTTTVTILGNVEAATLANPGSTASTTYVDLGGPEVTVTVPASGKVILTAGAYIGNDCTASAIIGGLVGYAVDGGAVVDFTVLNMGSNSGNESLQANPSRTTLLTGLSAGNHTIRLHYRAIDTQGGNSADFANAFIVAVPLVA